MCVCGFILIKEARFNHLVSIVLVLAFRASESAVVAVIGQVAKVIHQFHALLVVALLFLVLLGVSQQVVDTTGIAGNSSCVVSTVQWFAFRVVVGCLINIRSLRANGNIAEFSAEVSG